MKISEYARLHGVEQQTIRKYLSRHPEIRQHTHRDGQWLELDDLAVLLLDEVYSKPPIQVIKGIPIEDHENVLMQLNETQGKLNALHERVTALLEEKVEQQRQLAEAETVKLIAQKTEEELREEKRRVDELRDELSEEKRRVDELRAEVDRLKSRSLWERIRNI